VIVCGDGVGDIFRRNALNLGLHVVQSRAAFRGRAEGDVLTFDSKTATPDERDPWQELRARTADANRREHPSVRRHHRRRTARVRRIRSNVCKRGLAGFVKQPAVCPARSRSSGRIVVDKDAEVRPGGTLRVWCDLLPASDGTAPFAIHTFNQITGGDTIYPRQVAIANDHFVFSGRNADDKQTSIGRDFAKLHDITKPYYATPGDGSSTFTFRSRGSSCPGRSFPGADSHSRAYGAYGAVGTGVAARSSASVGRPATLFHAGEAPARGLYRKAAALGQRQGRRAGAAAPVGESPGARHERRVRPMPSASCPFRIATPSRT